MRPRRSTEDGNVIICALCTILIISLIGANVLRNCTTRFNVSSSQVRSWKESLFAAEAGGDIAYAQVRKTVLDPPHAFTGWTNSGMQHVSPLTTFGSNGLATISVVDLFYSDPITGNAWYRSRSKGTAPVNGMSRTGMDDRMGAGSRGDSLLRKIDFQTDHFVATYGPNGDGVGKTLVTVPNPQITRRIEQISAPVTPFEAAIKCTGSFYGLGSAAQVDSYNSKNGPYYFAANNPADPHFSDSRSGSVEIGTPVASRERYALRKYQHERRNAPALIIHHRDHRQQCPFLLPAVSDADKHADSATRAHQCHLDSEYHATDCCDRGRADLLPFVDSEWKTDD